MSTTGLSGIQLAAALAEQIYRRNANDDPIKLSSFDALAISVGTLNRLVGDSFVDDVTYYSKRGLVGQAIAQGNTFKLFFVARMLPICLNVSNAAWKVSRQRGVHVLPEPNCSA